MRPALLAAMAAQYTRPSSHEQACLIDALRSLEEAQDVELRIETIATQSGVPWALDERIVDVHINFGRNYDDEFFAPTRASFGSGYSTDLLAAAAHAASECLERSAVDASGQRGIRPGDTYAWSEFSGQWLHLPYNPLRPYLGKTKNPDYSRSGEAYHLSEPECLRAAFCEVLERDALNRGLRTPTECTDLTAILVEGSTKVRAVESFWHGAGYQFALVLLPSPFNVTAVLAIVRKNGPEDFRYSFKGVGADFRLEHAVEQAISELGRNAFTGPALDCTDEAALRKLLSDESVSTSIKPNLAMLSPRFKSAVDPFFGLLSSSSMDVALHQARCGPAESLASLKEAGKELWLVPLIKGLNGIPGFAYKVIIPGLPQNCHLVPDWHQALK